MSYSTQNKNFHIHVVFVLPSSPYHASILLNDPAIKVESFYLWQSHWLCLPRANLNRTGYKSFNDFHLLLDKNQKVKRKKKWQQNPKAPLVTSRWLQPKLVLKPFFTHVTRLDCSAHSAAQPGPQVLHKHVWITRGCCRGS